MAVAIKNGGAVAGDDAAQGDVPASSRVHEPGSRWSRVNWGGVGAALTEAIGTFDHEAIDPLAVGVGAGTLERFALLLTAVSQGCTLCVRSVDRLGVSVGLSRPPSGPWARAGSERMVAFCIDAVGKVAIEHVATRLTEQMPELAGRRPIAGLDVAGRRRLALCLAIVLGLASASTAQGHWVATALEIGPAPGWGMSPADRAEANRGKPDGWAACWPGGIIARAGVTVGRGAGGSGEVSVMYESASASGAVFAAVRAWERSVVAGVSVPPAGSAELLTELIDMVSLIEGGGQPT